MAVNSRRFARFEMYVPGLALKHELARKDQELAERITGVKRNPHLERENAIMSAYQEVAGTKGMARMARADHKYKTATHRFRLMEKKL
jgi:hypothetical protein